MQRDTKQILLLTGHKLAVKHGLGYLTSKVMQEATGFYRYSIMQHFKNIAGFREAVRAHGIKNGTIRPDEKVRCPRMSPAERKAELLNEAFTQAQDKGLKSVTRISVAQAKGVTDGLVSRYFGNTSGLHTAVLAKAAAEHEPDIVADAIELGMSVQHVPPDLVAQARQILAAA